MGDVFCMCTHRKSLSHSLPRRRPASPRILIQHASPEDDRYPFVDHSHPIASCWSLTCALKSHAIMTQTLKFAKLLSFSFPFFLFSFFFFNSSFSKKHIFVKPSGNILGLVGSYWVEANAKLFLPDCYISMND